MNMVVSHWSANAVVLIVIGTVAAMHLLGLAGTVAETGRLARPRWTGPEAGRQAAMFYCGLAAVVLALVSPLAYWSGRFIWVRSQQDVLLALAAPSLIVLGAPWLPLRRGAAALLPRPASRRPRRPSAAARRPWPDRRPGPAPFGRAWMTWPVAIAVVFNAAWLGWHVPGPYDAALRRPVLDTAEVVTYLGLGIAFWLVIIGSRPYTPRLVPLARAFLVTGSFTIISVFAMVLVFGNHVLYPAYIGPAHHVLSVVADQQIGGAVLWTGATLPFGVAVIALCVRWLSAEESGTLDAGTGHLLTRSASGWPSRPGFRW